MIYITCNEKKRRNNQMFINYNSIVVSYYTTLHMKIKHDDTYKKTTEGQFWAFGAPHISSEWQRQHILDMAYDMFFELKILL